MVVNENAWNQMPNGVFGFFASRLAPTELGTTTVICTAFQD
jgi:hypothetical protein